MHSAISIHLFFGFRQSASAWVFPERAKPVAKARAARRLKGRPKNLKSHRLRSADIPESAVSLLAVGGLPTFVTVIHLHGCSALQLDANKEAQLQLLPQERVLNVKPCWETIPDEDRVELLSVDLNDLRLRAIDLADKAKKQAGQISYHACAAHHTGCAV